MINTRIICSACYVILALGQFGLGRDFFLTIGGGYAPEANQASLEANVLFYRQVLSEEQIQPWSEDTFFADGYDDKADLQVLVEEPASVDSQTPATDLLESIFTFANRPQVEYRNHRVPDITGPIDPSSIHSGLRRLTAQMQSGDRLIVYVTSHGQKAKGDNRYDTTISCWNDQSISSREFAHWLDEVPVDVTVVMIMAQCYCGGFSHTIFNDADSSQGLSQQLRVGFFAQQHDLAAAGCRPDIENDEEYSSFFWGAFVGRSRSGKNLHSADFDRNGQISFAEAHARAVLTSNTIDVPLRTTEALLRETSRIPNYDHRRYADEDNAPPLPIDLDASAESLIAMEGTLREIGRNGTLDQRAIVAGIAESLALDLDADVTSVYQQYASIDSRPAPPRRGRFGRGRRGIRRRLWAEIAEQWPDFSDRRRWRDSDLLRMDNQQNLYREIVDLPSYQSFRRLNDERQAGREEALQTEVLQARYQRLINTLEAIVLAANLPYVADPDVVAKYKQLLAAEQSVLQLAPNSTDN